MRVPLVDLGAQQREVAAEVRDGIDSVLARTEFIGGPDVELFEQEYAAATDVGHCIGVGNGTDALELALRAVGVARDDEVVLPANSFIATAEAVSRIGAVPVLVDVDPDHLLIDPRLVGEAITARTRAIVPVHLFGQIAPVERIQALPAAAHIPIVEDAAQSQGARRHGRTSGSLGTIAATSFYPGKNLGAAGDAGGVTTDDAALARAVRVLANHGSPAKYVHVTVGMNSRLDSIQAVVLRAKLRRLAAWNERRAEAAAQYDEMLAPLRVVRPRSMPGNHDVWHQYVVRVERRDAVLAFLRDALVEAAVHYPTPIHLTGAYAHLGHGRGSFPVAENAADHLLSLPMHPHLTIEQQQHVVATLAAALRAAHPSLRWA